MILVTDEAGGNLVGAIDGANVTFTTSTDFISGTVNVYLGGLLLPHSDFTATTPRSVVLGAAPTIGATLAVEYQADVRTGGGALGGLPPAPILTDLRPRISDAFEKEEDD